MNDDFSLIETLCENKDYDKAAAQFDTYFSKQSSEHTRPGFIRSSDRSAKDLWDPYLPSHRFMVEDTDNYLNELAETIKEDFVETKKAHQDIISFATKKEELECITAYIKVACMFACGYKDTIKTAYENGDGAAVLLMKNAWKYNFYLMKVLTVGLLNMFCMIQMEENNEKITNMGENALVKNNGLFNTRMHQFISRCFSAHGIATMREVPDTVCYACNKAATKDVKCVISPYVKVGAPGGEKIHHYKFVFCSACKITVSAFLCILKYGDLVKRSMQKFSAKAQGTSKPGEISIGEFLGSQQKTQINNIRLSVRYFLNAFCNGASLVTDEMVFGMAQTLPSLLLDKNDPWYNPQKIKSIPITFVKNKTVDEMR